MATNGTRKYTQEQVAQILRRALEHKEQLSLSDGYSHQELVETAREVGISPAALERAIAEEADERAKGDEIAKWKAGRKAAWKGGLMTFWFVNLLLLFIDYFTGGGWWVHWVAGPWALILLFSALQLNREPTAAEVAKIEERRLKRLRAEERRKRLQQTSEAWEDVVHHGVNVVVGALGDGLKKLDERQRRRKDQD